MHRAPCDALAALVVGHDDVAQRLRDGHPLVERDPMPEAVLGADARVGLEAAAGHVHDLAGGRVLRLARAELVGGHAAGDVVAVGAERAQVAGGARRGAHPARAARAVDVVLDGVQRADGRGDALCGLVDDRGGGGLRPHGGGGGGGEEDGERLGEHGDHARAAAAHAEPTQGWTLPPLLRPEELGARDGAPGKGLLGECDAVARAEEVHQQAHLALDSAASPTLRSSASWRSVGAARPRATGRQAARRSLRCAAEIRTGCWTSTMTHSLRYPALRASYAAAAMRHSTRILTTLLAAAGLAIPTATAAADPPPPLTPQTSFATAQKIAGVTAAAGWTAWSEQSGSTWQLKVRSPSGVLSAPAIAARAIPFDASLGVRSGGAVVLAYSRCTRDPRFAAGGVSLAWYTARGCVVHLLDPVTGADRRAARDERLDRRRAAVRVGRNARLRDDRAPRQARVDRHAALAGGKPRVLDTGPADRVNTDQVDANRGPALVAIHAGHVAFVWNVVQGLGKHDVGVQAFGINLYVVDRGRVLNVDAEGGAGDGACAGYTRTSRR